MKRGAAYVAGETQSGDFPTTSDAVQKSLGPTGSDVQFNGVPYHAQDSGRVRSIVPHPTEPGILYLATAGGGVWKTYDAGGRWEPITDQALGSTAIGALVFRTTRDVNLCVTEDAGERATDKSTGMAGRRDVGIVEHSMAMPA